MKVTEVVKEDRNCWVV